MTEAAAAGPLKVRIVARRDEATDIVALDLESLDGQPLPAFEAGAHVDVRVRSDLLRQYSLSSFRYGGDDSTRTSVFTSAVLHSAQANVYPSKDQAVAALLKSRERRG